MRNAQSVILTVTLSAAMLAGCTRVDWYGLHLPPPRELNSDLLPTLAGTWAGQMIVGRQGNCRDRTTNELRATVSDDGMVRLASRSRPEAQIPGRLTLREGTLQFESLVFSGAMDLHEGDGRRLLTYHGKYADDGSPLTLQLAPIGQRTGTYGVSLRQSLESDSVRTLAGEWQGWSSGECDTIPHQIDLKVEETGDVQLSTKGRSFTGTIRIAEGKLMLDTASRELALTLYEYPDRAELRGNGRYKDGSERMAIVVLRTRR